MSLASVVVAKHLLVMTVGTKREVDTETVRKNGVLARERIMSCTEKVKETRCD